MATTFKNRVEDYIGSYRGSIVQLDWLTAMSEWLTASARELFEIAPITRLRMMSSPLADVPVVNEVGGVYGYDIAGKRIISVTRLGYPADEIDDSDYAKYLDSDSIYKATDRDPVYYVTNGFLKIIPATEDATSSGRTGQIHFVEAPSVDYDSVSIANFPPEFETTVVLGAAIKARVRQLAEKRSGFTALDLSAYSVVTAPSAPNIQSIDAVASGITTTTINIGGLTAPTFSKPTVTLDFSAVDTYIDTEEDTELSQAKIAKISAQLQEYQADIQNELHEFNKENVDFQADVQVALQNAQLLQQELITEAQLATDVSKHNKIQEMQAHIQDYTLELQRWGASVQDYSAKVQAAVQEHTSNQQRVIQEHQLMMQELQVLQGQYQAALQILMQGQQKNLKPQVEE